MTMGQILGGSLLLFCGLAIFVMGFGVFKATKWYEVGTTLFLGAASIALGAQVLIN